MERDPVCGMDIERDQAAGRSEHDGRTYFFCSEECKKEFDLSPSRYEGQATASR